MRFFNKHLLLGVSVFAVAAAALLFNTVSSSGRVNSERVLPTDLSDTASRGVVDQSAEPNKKSTAAASSAKNRRFN